MIIESHAHYSCRKFSDTFTCLSIENGEKKLLQSTRGELLDKLKSSGIAHIIEPAIALETNEEISALCDQYPGFLHSAVGVHPTRTWAVPWAARKKLPALSENPHVVAIGETGLDYHYERKQQHRTIQVMWFLYQIRLAHRRRLPLILHIRQADRDAIRILRLHRRLLHGGVAHCFSGDAKTAKAYLDLGLHIGIGGALLQDADWAQPLKEAVKEIPLSRILLETDSPFVLPPCRDLCSRKASRKVCNTSLILPAVLQEIARLKGVSYEEAENVIYENTLHLFGLS